MTSVGKVVVKLELLSIAGGNQWKMLQPMWKMVRQFLKKLQRLPFDALPLSIPLLGMYILKRIESKD